MAAALCLPATIFLAQAASAAPASPALSDYSALPLLRGQQNQLMLRMSAPGGSAYVVLDTGSPITCVDEAKSKLFGLVPSSKQNAAPVSVIVNGERHRIAIAPSMKFGSAVEIQNLPVVMVDLGALNQMLKSRKDRPNDAIVGLDTLHALNAVLDCGNGRLLLPNNSGGAARLGARLKREGWTEIPMQLSGAHLVVHGTVNRVPLDFVVDTGSPVSVLDQAFARSHKIALTEQTFSMRAIHFESGGAKVGRVADLHIGKLGLGRSLVAVFDIAALLRNQSGLGGGPHGLLGSRTLMRARAYIDCENSRLYLKMPSAGSTWEF